MSTNMVNPKTGDYDDLLHIGPGNIESFTGRILDNVNTVKNDNLISGKFHFNPNDIIYGKINPQLAKYVHVDFEGLASADAYVLNSKNGVNQGFLFVELQTSGFYKYSVSVSMRTGMPKINRDELNQFSYLAPKNIEEQQRIGSFFKQLDETIALHQRKLDKLNLLKQGYLQQLFPQNDEKVPRVRFANFKNEWEQRKLGSLATIVRGASPRPIQDPKWFDNESDIGWLRITDVTEQDGRIYHLEQHISKLGQAKTRVLIEPHLLLSIAATVGKPVVNYVKTGVHDGFLIFLSPTFEREFMFQWLEMFRPKWQKYGQPGSQVNLNSELVRNQEIVLPNHKEQQKIGVFLKQIDKAIILHKSKLDKLISLKKVLLQKMFI